MEKGWNQKNKGFTIVELLIVIVVVAILAAITIAAYNGVQDRSNDTRVRSGANQLEKAIRMWAIQTGDFPKGGWSSTAAIGAGTNCADGTGGWVASGAYLCSLEDVLISKQLVPSGFARGLPKNSTYPSDTDGVRTTMFYACSGGKYALYWNLRSPTADDAASLTYVESQGCTSAPRTTYGMRAAKLIDLNQ